MAQGKWQLYGCYRTASLAKAMERGVRKDLGLKTKFGAKRGWKARCVYYKKCGE